MSAASTLAVDRERDARDAHVVRRVGGDLDRLAAADALRRRGDARRRRLARDERVAQGDAVRRPAAGVVLHPVVAVGDRARSTRRSTVVVLTSGARTTNVNVAVLPGRDARLVERGRAVGEDPVRGVEHDARAVARVRGAEPHERRGPTSFVPMLRATKEEVPVSPDSSVRYGALGDVLGLPAVLGARRPRAARAASATTAPTAVRVLTGQRIGRARGPRRGPRRAARPRRRPRGTSASTRRRARSARRRSRSAR